MQKRGLIKIIFSILTSMFFLTLVGIGLIFYFNLFDDISNAVVGMYYVNKGDKALRKRKLPKAVEYYLKGLKAYPKHYEAWTNLGNIYVIFEDYYDAREAYKKAIEQKPDYTMARMNYGIIATEKLGDFEEAISQFNNIINAKHSWFIIPFIYDSKKSNKINKALAYYNMGVAYRLKSFYESENIPQAEEDLKFAIQAYENALKILPKDYNTIFNLGLAYQLNGDSREAAQKYCNAITLEPMRYEAHYNLAILLRHLKMYTESYNEIEKASILAAEGKNINTNTLNYVFDILNDMSMTLIQNDDYKALLEHQQSNELTYKNGKLVASDELDKTILKSLKRCEAEEYINGDDD